MNTKFWISAGVALLACVGCAGQNVKTEPAKTAKSQNVKTIPGQQNKQCDPSTSGPCVSPTENREIDYDSRVHKERRIWADKRIGTVAPKLQIETWLGGKKPDLKGKLVLVEFWNTWCPPCRRSLALLNKFQKKFGKEIVIIGICDESKEAVEKLFAKPGHSAHFYIGLDPKARAKKDLNVWGVPHAILIEPQERVIIWEGFPLLKNYELTEDVLANALRICKQLQAEGKANASNKK